MPVITWIVSVVFAFAMLKSGLLHRNFIFIPEYIISAVLYIVLAGAMGARGNYSKEQAEYAAFEQALKDLVDRDAEANQGGNTLSIASLILFKRDVR